jgi:hypothetical protein
MDSFIVFNEKSELIYLHNASLIEYCFQIGLGGPI